MSTQTTRQHLARMARLLDMALSTDNPAIAAEYIAQVQRLSGHALREAVADSIEAGQTDWRWLATAVQTPPGTLRKQYERGGRIVIHDPKPPTEPDYDVEECPEPRDGHVYTCCGKVGRISRHETWCTA